MALLGHRNLLTTAAFYTLMNSHWAQKTTVGSFQECIHSIVRGEPEPAPNTRDTGSGFICKYIYVCLCGDYFHEQGVKLQIANVGNGRQARVRTTLKVHCQYKVICRNGQGKL